MNASDTIRCRTWQYRINLIRFTIPHITPKVQRPTQCENQSAFNFILNIYTRPCNQNAWSTCSIPDITRSMNPSSAKLFSGQLGVRRLFVVSVPSAKYRGFSWAQVSPVEVDVHGRMRAGKFLSHLFPVTSVSLSPTPSPVHAIRQISRA
jgi:hypothetical protein